MVASSSVIFPMSMADVLTNPVEICFGSFMKISTTLAAATSSMVSTKVLATPVAAPSSNQKSKTHPPKPYDIVQGMEQVIDMTEETLQICERAQHSTQDASHRKTFPFGLRPSSDAHARQAAKTIQIQSGWRDSSVDLKIKPHARRDPLDVPCTYHKGTWHTLRGCRLRKKIDQECDASRGVWTPRLQTSAQIRVSPND
jgi:hypothetical protein